jgi:hypothetical protein
VKKVSHQLLTYTGQGPSKTGFNKPKASVTIVTSDQHVALEMGDVTDDLVPTVAVERRTDGQKPGYSVGIQTDGEVRLTVFISDRNHISVKDEHGNWLYGVDENGLEIEKPEWDDEKTE